MEARDLEKPYKGCTLIRGGQAGIKLSRDRKDPDFSIYVHNPTSIHQCNIPTVALETAYTESEETLTMDAARLLCLSAGLVQLVIAVNFVHTREGNGPRQLKKVEWAHWEVVEMEKVDPSMRSKGPWVVERDEREMPMTYTAIVDVGEGKKESITASKVESFQVSLSFTHSFELSD